MIKNHSNQSVHSTLTNKNNLDEEDDSEEDEEDEDIGLTHEEISQFEIEYHELTCHSKFQLLQFESLIRKQHQSVAERLWRLVVIKGNLFNHLQVRHTHTYIYSLSSFSLSLSALDI